MHSSLPPPPPPPSAATPIRVVPDIPGRGRALVAARAIKPGEVLLTDSPLLLYPALDSADGSFSSSFCGHCYRTLAAGVPRSPLASVGALPLCPGCSGQVRFCGEPCRAMALLSSHTPWACRALSMIRSAGRLPPPLDGAEGRSQVAFLVAAYNLAAASPEDFRRLLSLQGDAGDHASPELPLALHSLMGSISPPLDPAGFSPELTAALLSKDRMNAFGLMEPAGVGSGGEVEKRVRAYGIYPNASLFNHDCLPNACRFDYVDGGSDRNTEIIVRAIHEIPEGRELCLSYFPVNWTFKERQKRLLEDYGFSCACDRCLVEKGWKEQDEEEEKEDHKVASMEDEEAEDDEDEGMEGVVEEGDGDFPHAYFFVRFMCQRENCGGTLAPLPPSPQGVTSGVMECNACGGLRKGDDPCDDGGGEDDGIVVDG